MLELTYRSARGEELPLSENPLFYLTNVDGLTSASGAVASSSVGAGDGDSVNSVRVDPRGIVLDLRIKSGANVEQAKREILRVIKIKQRGTLIWTQEERTLTISGIVETIEMPRFTNAVTLQISMHCDVPYWEDAENIISNISGEDGLHYFTENASDMLFFPAEGIPFSEYDTIRTKPVFNDGDVSVGAEIHIIALDKVTNPIIRDANGNFFGFGFEKKYVSTDPAGNQISSTSRQEVVLSSGDELIITTHRGNKTATLNGTNIIDKVKPGSTWLQVEAGENQFSIDAVEESVTNMSFFLMFKRRFI